MIVTFGQKTIHSRFSHAACARRKNAGFCAFRPCHGCIIMRRPLSAGNCILQFDPIGIGDHTMREKREFVNRINILSLRPAGPKI